MYAIDNIIIRSDWFDWTNPRRKILDIGYKGLFVYFSLFHFLVRGQEYLYTFYTSIKQIHRTTGYNKKTIIDTLKLLKRLNVIEIEPARWDRIDDNTLLIIYAIDVPQIIIKKDDSSGELKAHPATDNDYWISVNFPLLELYKQCDLNEKYYPLYCLLRKLSYSNPEREAYMSIIKMADTLGYSRETITKMIHTMQDKGFLISHKRKSVKGNIQYKHHIVANINEYRQIHAKETKQSAGDVIYEMEE